MWGSIIFPALSYFLGGFIFGWAKPVPVNVYNLRNQKWGELIVAIAGPISNLTLAVLGGLVIRYMNFTEPTPLLSILATIVLTNLVLAIFNLIPIPPLDGSKVLAGLLPLKYSNFIHSLNSFGFIAVLFFALVIWQFVTPLVSFLFSLITGIGM
jgi:Zn-dependent protease